MIVEAQVTIQASRAAVWSAITDIEHAAKIISGIENIEILNRPPSGLVGLKWRETRTLFGKPATVEKWITDATEGECYTTRAEDGGFVFVTTKSIAETSGGMSLSESHESKPQGLVATLSVPMLFLFKVTVKKHLLQDLKDIKAAVESDPKGTA